MSVAPPGGCGIRRDVQDDAQGSGLMVDLARVQRGSALKKILTTFYHFFGTTFFSPAGGGDPILYISNPPGVPPDLRRAQLERQLLQHRGRRAGHVPAGDRPARERHRAHVRVLHQRRAGRGAAVAPGTFSWHVMSSLVDEVTTQPPRDGAEQAGGAAISLLTRRASHLQ